MKFGVWLKGFAAAVIGGAATSAGQAASTGSLQPAQLKGSAIAGALLTAGAYLTKSPLSNSTSGSDPNSDPKK